MSPFKNHSILQDAFNVTSHAITYHKWEMYEGFHTLAIKDFNLGGGRGWGKGEVRWFDYKRQQEIGVW